MRQYTTISVKDKTYQRLFSRKKTPNDSMDSIINRLLDNTVGMNPFEIEVENKNKLLKHIKESIDIHFNGVVADNNVIRG